MTDSRYNQFLEFIDEIKEIERFEFTESVRTSDQAVLVSGFTKANFAKTILLKHKEDDLFVAAIIPIGSTVDKKSLVEGVKPKRWRLA
ncbi:MAG: hypothetical protein OEY49_17000, partial [Candidatus Heimdallarchaeota archaeon]|nr:hypothetical protein [Candidatus Heimdallarchaeota archaeon]